MDVRTVENQGSKTPTTTQTLPCVETSDWQQLLSQAFKRPKDLLDYLELGHLWQPESDLAHSAFRTLVPLPFAQQMKKGDINDPLLLQVLPVAEELSPIPGYTEDPLGESDANPLPGIVHKYHGRILVIFASGCAVNCRYCFRRHFPYADNQLSTRQLDSIIKYLQQHPEVDEVILSGGDPLIAPDGRLARFCQQLNDLPQVSRLRIHSRLPIVLPQRVTHSLIDAITWPQLETVMVVHCNHPQELSNLTQQALNRLRQANIHLLNQTVLLKNVNDAEEIQIELSKKLFKQGAMPYYLHLLDKVAGAAHHDVNETTAIALVTQMRHKLPGYLVPKLVREQAGMQSKTPVPL